MNKLKVKINLTAMNTLGMNKIVLDQTISDSSNALNGYLGSTVLV